MKKAKTTWGNNSVIALVRGLVLWSIISYQTSTSALAGVPTQSTSTCPQLSNQPKAIAPLLKLFTNHSFDETQLGSIFSLLDHQFPTLSPCLASINPVEVAQVVANASQCLRDQSSAHQPPVSPGELNDEYFRQYFCPQYIHSTVPCVTSAISAISSVMDAADGGCCQMLQQHIVAAMGSTFRDWMDVLLKLIGNVLCSTRVLPDHDESQTCGDALLMSLLLGDPLYTITTALQIPHSQMCRAMMGKRFYTTRGLSAQFFTNSETEPPLGVCHAPIDALLHHISRYPMVSNSRIQTNRHITGTTMRLRSIVTVSFSNLFVRGQCLRWDDLLYWASGADNVVMNTLSLLDQVLNTGIKESEEQQLIKRMQHELVQWSQAATPYCFHLSTLIPCTYQNKKLTLAFPETKGSISPSVLAVNSASTDSVMAHSGATETMRQLGIGVLCMLLLLHLSIST